ncbi:MAG: C39 family peptidase [Eubacterium sp.]|nr:C39 family peptidase [Eubacterium sp.]
MKKLLRIISIVLCAVLISAPFSCCAAETGFLNGIGNDFFAFFGREKINEQPLSVYEDLSYDELQSVEATMTDANIYLEHSYMTLQVERYNIVLNNWYPISFVHNGYSIYLSDLTPGTFYKIRIIYLGNPVGEYSFFTNPKGINNLKLNVDGDKRINLSWDNPRGQLTEIFKRLEGENLKYIGATYESTYKDYAVKQGNGYGYKLRFVCKNPEAVSFSEFSGVSTYVEEDIDDIIKADGYVIIRQTDANNRNIPYPYNGNSKTIGSSGCGVCASLMVIRNTSSYKPTVEGYTNELLKAGCRKSYGSDMLAIAEYMKGKYGFSYKTTKDVNELKRHLDKGYMATAHVGTANLFTTTTGHFVTVAGYAKGKKTEKVIILDPGFGVNKYSASRRVEAGIEYNSKGILTAPFDTLLADCKGEYFVLFTPPKR